MADSVTIGSATGVKVSSEEITSLDGVTVAAEQVQRVIPMTRTADSTVVGGSAMSTKLDPINDGVTAYVFGNSYTVISTASTTTIKTGSGIIRQIRVLGGTLGNVTVYDNTAGSGSTIVPTNTPAGPTILAEDIAFSTGLTIVAAAATLILVTYR